MNTPNTAQLQHAFDLASLDAESLTPWASVHRGRTHSGADVVIKRTASSAGRAHAMADWTRALAGAGIPVVTPSDLTVANPQPVAGDQNVEGAEGKDQPEWWVAYPFVAGRPYAGSDSDIGTAGDLLGRIHAVDLPPELRTNMRPYSWPETERQEVDADLQTLADVLRRHGGNRAEEAIATIRALAERWWSTSLPQLRAEDEADPLPRAGVTSDYKACNLIFPEAARAGGASQRTEPVLVDPDNGGIEPRIFDLALALLLFHNECLTAPGRLLSDSEWHRFVSAYIRHVDLTDRERALWPLALDHMLWEEGTWALEDNDDEAWADPRQGAQLLDLALAAPGRYPLPTSALSGRAERA